MALKAARKIVELFRRKRSDAGKPYIASREPRMSGKEAIDSAFKQYDEALKNLAKHKPV